MVARERVDQDAQDPCVDHVRDDRPHEDGSARDEDARAELAEVVDELGLLAVVEPPGQGHYDVPLVSVSRASYADMSLADAPRAAACPRR